MVTRASEKGYLLSSVDPGGESGLSLLHVKPDGFELLDYQTVRYRPSELPPPTSTLIAWRQMYPGEHELVFENFHIRNDSSAAAKDPTALMVIGGIEQMLYDRSPYIEVTAQEPIEGKHSVTDEKLEELNLHLDHKYTQRHVRDSLRHAVALLIKRRYRPVCHRAFSGRTGPGKS